MPITERLMLPGSFAIRLVPDTPKDVRDALAFWGHVVVLGAPLDVRRVTDATVLAAARYVGILRHRPTVLDLAGVGLASWLGDDQVKGPIYEAAQTLVNGTFGGWLTQLIPAGFPVALGTVTALAGALSWTFQWKTPREALATVMQYFGGEFRVNPNATLDAGPASALFNLNPTAIAQRLPGGRDINVVGLPATQLDLDQDVEDYATRVLYFGSSGSEAGSTIVPATSYKDLRGNLVALSRMVTDATAPAAALATLAAAEAKKTQFTRQQVRLSTDLYDIGRDVHVGDNVWVYDAAAGLVDSTQQVRYRGEVLSPVQLRALAMTWPVERGLAVCYRDLNGAYTDLTNYVEPEPAGVSFELGAAARRLAD